MKKIAIIGGGVAGLTAAIYARRANADVTIFEQYGLGGLVATIDKIENYPSYAAVSGFDLARSIAEQAKQVQPTVITRKVLSLTMSDGRFTVSTAAEQLDFPAVVIATGTSHNKLGVEADYVGRGVSYCATCDGNFYRGCPVLVVGGGNAAVREALYLSDLCSAVYVAVPAPQFTADDMSVDLLLSKPNVKAMYNTSVSHFCSDEPQGMLSGAALYTDGALHNIAIDGAFVATGAVPVTDFLHVDGVQNERGYIKVDGKCCTTVPGLYAAGDVTDGALKQIVTACADGAKAGFFAAAYSATVK